MKTLCIVSCGGKKIWEKNQCAGPTEARFAYTGNFAKKCRQYAERFHPSSWCVLSAKYGFLFPDDIIPGPYCVTFNKKSTNPISVASLSAQVSEKGLGRYDEIIVLAGKEYVRVVEDVFPGKQVNAPLAGLRIGQKNSVLKNSIENRRPL